MLTSSSWGHQEMVRGYLMTGKGIVRFLPTGLQAWAVDKWESACKRELGCLGCAWWFPLLRKWLIGPLCISQKYQGDFYLRYSRSHASGHTQMSVSLGSFLVHSMDFITPSDLLLHSLYNYYSRSYRLLSSFTSCQSLQPG